jgi:phosphatidylinositol glycan class B
MWVFLGIQHLANSIAHGDVVGVLMKTALVVAAVLVCSLLVDGAYYGRWVVVQANFLAFNVAHGISLYYGYHPWHFYLTQGLPLVLFTHLPVTVLGLESVAWSSSSMVPVFACAFYTGCLSVLGHKEFRFLLPCLPVLMVYAGAGLARVQRVDQAAGRTLATSRLARWLVFLLATNIAMAGYFSRIHKAGQVNPYAYTITARWVLYSGCVARLQAVVLIV